MVFQAQALTGESAPEAAVIAALEAGLLSKQQSSFADYEIEPFASEQEALEFLSHNALKVFDD